MSAFRTVDLHADEGLEADGLAGPDHGPGRVIVRDGELVGPKATGAICPENDLLAQVRGRRRD